MKKFIIVALGLFVLPAFMQAADDVASDVSTSDVAVETIADSAPVKEDPSGDDPVVSVSKGADIILPISNTAVTNTADESGDDTDEGGNGNGGNNGGSNSSGGSKKKKTTSETEGLVLGVETFKFNNNLWQGMRSDEVKELQKRLRAEGFFTFPEDNGYFGPITLAAVKEYQASRGIWTTGFVGMITRAALNR